MNDIPSGVIVFLSFIVVIIGVLLYGFMGDMLAKHTRKEAIERKMEARMFRAENEANEAHIERMKELYRESAARTRREARQANRRRFLGSHR